jgi:ribosomal protein S17
MQLNLLTGLTPDNAIKHIMFVVKDKRDKTVFITATTSLYCVLLYRIVEDRKLGSGC